MFTIQLLHASDLEGGLDAIENAPNFAAVVDALRAEAAGVGVETLLLSAGDNYIPGPFYNAGGDERTALLLEGFYNEFFGLIDVSVLDASADLDGNGFYDNGEIDLFLSLSATLSAADVYVLDVNGDGFPDYFDEIDTFGGRVDVAIMNAIGFDASAVGNHEFDAGDGAFYETIQADPEQGNSLSSTNEAAVLAAFPGHVNFLQEVDHPGVQFPYLSSNLDVSASDLGRIFTDEIRDAASFATDLTESRVDLADPTVTGSDSRPDKIAAAAKIVVGGETIGVVGATTQRVATISSVGGVTETTGGANDMAALAAVIQHEIDALVAEGVNKIVLVSHLQQISLEKDLAGRLSGVDVIVAGGSGTLQADANDRLRAGDAPAEGYPFEGTNADGDPVLIVSTDGEYSYVGRLTVTFDAEGVVDLSALSEDTSGAYATDALGVTDLGGDVTAGAAAQVANLTAAVTEIVTEKDGEIAGVTTVYLNGDRGDVRTQETNFGNLTAEANLAAAQALDPSILVSIKNGGGIRAPIGEVVETSPGVYEALPPQANPLSGKEAGEISLLDIENALRFDNGLATIALTPEQLKIVLEHAVAAVAPGDTPGQFPQVAGLAFSFDPTAQAQGAVVGGVPTTPGERVKTVALLDAAGEPSRVIYADGAFAEDAPASIGVVALDFLALFGGDGYPFNQFGTPVPLGISEQDALFDYLEANHSARAVIASAIDGTDLNLIEAVNPFAGAFSSAGDGAEVYQRGVSASIPFNLADDSDGSFAADTLGLVATADTAPFFGVTDTVNDDNPTGEVTASWRFDVAGATDLALSIDIAAMGDFETSDVFSFEAAFDGGAAVTLFETAVDEAGSFVYAMADGDLVTLDDPISIGGVTLSNVFTTFTADLVGTGSELTLTFRGVTDGAEGFAFRDITVTGDGEVAPNPYSEADTPIHLDERIVNLSVQEDRLDVPAPSGALVFERVFQYQAETPDPSDPEGGSEVVSFDDGRLYTTNGASDRIDVIDAATGLLAGFIDLSGLPGYDGVQSVAARGGLIAVAVARGTTTETLFGEARELSQPGFVALFDAESLSLISTVDVGHLPDSLAFTPDGTKVVVAGEGEFNGDSDYDNDPLGTVAVIDVTDPANASARILDFTKFAGLEDAARAAGVRIKEGAGIAADLEPEYVAISPDGTTAYVSLQENNAIAVVDLVAGEVRDVIGLGTRDFGPGNGFDPLDDGTPNVRVFGDEVVGLFMPDAIAAYEAGGRTYIVTANEGDSRDFDEARVEDLVEDGLLDPDFERSLREKGLIDDDPDLDVGLERLEVLTTEGDLDGDGDIDQLVAFSTRSVSIFDEDGTLVADSGSLAERFLAANFPDRFNDDDGRDRENRSDAKGPEFEAVTIGEVGGRTYVFAGAERDSGVFVFDVTDPTDAEFVQYIDGFANGDRSPEVIAFIPAAESATGRAQIAVSYEVSGTTSLFDILETDTTIMAVQGESHVSPLLGREVTVSGVVTAFDRGGFYIQDPVGDGNDATSDGVFVLSGAAVAVGDAVTVTGEVEEFGFGDLTTTRIAAEAVTVDSSGNPLPAATVLGAAGRAIPTEVVISDDETPTDLNADPNVFDPEEDGIDFYESLEGMLVTVDDPIAISPTNRFGETWVAADRGAGTTPGLNDRFGLDFEGDADGYGDLNPERIQIQRRADTGGGSFDDLNQGDLLADVTGVMSYDFGNYEIRLTGNAVVETPSPLTPEITTLASGERVLTVATYNVLNVTAATGTGDPDDDDAAQIATLGEHIAINLGAPDVVALQEIQDDSGVSNGADDGVLGADATLQALIDAVAAAGGPAYLGVSAIVDQAGETGGVPGGNIRNAYLYRADRLSDVVVQTLESAELAALGVTDPEAFNAFDTRDPLLMTFTFAGREIAVINNHWDSRSGSDAIFGPIQPFAQGNEAAREAQAKAINEVVDALVAATPGLEVIVAGDLNTFEFTNDLTEILPGAGADRVLGDLRAFGDPADGGSYNFQGNQQNLDHIFATDGLAARARFDTVNVNTDFAVAASDHDPLLAAFDFAEGVDDRGGRGRDEFVGGAGDDSFGGGKGSDVISGGLGDDVLSGGRGRDVIFGDRGNDDLAGGRSRDELFGGLGDDTLAGGRGRDVLTGGEGDDVFVLAAADNAWDEITDFVKGEDRIALKDFGDDLGDLDIVLRDKGGRTIVRIDGDRVAAVTSDDHALLSVEDFFLL